MSEERIDPATGRQTTGHEWNGIEELETPIPRVVLFFLAITTLFAISYWILMPAWPLGTTYTKGLLGVDQHAIVKRQLADATDARAVWLNRIANDRFSDIASDSTLMRNVRETGRTLFIDNCSACHGMLGTGGPGFPNLTDKSWLWGGTPDEIATTIRVGINSTHPETRSSQMPAFGEDGILSRDQVLSAAAFVRSLSGLPMSLEDKTRIDAGRAVFTDNCAACHGENAKGKTDVGAPNLTDAFWIYGGDAQTVFTTIFHGRQGLMPTWENRLPVADIRLLALYVKSLGEASR